MGLYDKKENGTAGSISNFDMDQKNFDTINNISDLLSFGERLNVPMEHSQESKISLKKSAFLIKASVLDRIGMFDEDFSLNEYSVKDLMMRTLAAGYKNVLCRNSFIIHFGTEFVQEKTEDYRVMLQNDYDKLNEKWGFHVEYYL